MPTIGIFNIYKHDKYSIWESKARKIFIFQDLTFYEQLKFYARELSMNFFITLEPGTVRIPLQT